MATDEKTLYADLFKDDPEATWTAQELEMADGAETHFKQYLFHLLGKLVVGTRADHGYVALSGVKPGEYTPVVAYGRDLASVTPASALGGETLVSRHLWTAEQLIVLPNPTALPGYCGEQDVHEKVLIKLLGHGELYGFISLDTRNPQGFSVAARQALSVCIPELQWRVAEQNFSMRIRTLAAPFATIEDPSQLDTLYAEVVDRVVHAFAADGATLRIYEPEYDLLVVRAVRGDTPANLLVDRSPGVGTSGIVFVDQEHGWSLVSGVGQRTQITSGAQLPSEALTALRQADIDAYFAMRLQPEMPSKQHPVGTLSCHYRRPHSFSWRDVALFRAYCQRVADAITLQYQQRELLDSYNSLRVQSRRLTQIEVLSLVAHDLFHKAFNANSAMELYITRARKALNDKKQRRSHDHLEADALAAREASQAVARSLDQLRGLQQAEPDAYKDRTTFRLIEIVKEMESTLAFSLKRNQVTIDQRIPDTLILPGPRIVLEHALYNLLINAIDAAKGRPRPRAMKIHIHAQTQGPDDRKFAVLTIWDEGPGIDRSRFRDPNDVFRIGSTTKPTGTGTGLPVARSLLTLYYRGNLTLEDPERALFRVSIPLFNSPLGPILEETA